VRFARSLPDASPFAPREVIAGEDSRTLAHELLAMTQEEFSLVFKNSPMKRAKLRGLKRNAAVVLGNLGSPANVPALAAALSDDEPLVRAHAAWALERIGSPAAVAAIRARVSDECHVSVVAALRAALSKSGT
jgi:epoxyqueuosine reductase